MQQKLALSLLLQPRNGLDRLYPLHCHHRFHSLINQPWRWTHHHLIVQVEQKVMQVQQQTMQVLQQTMMSLLLSAQQML
jgi:hypothetical protein